MLIGIDAGGTKNELALCENDGRVVNRMTAPGSNAADLGPENAAMRIASQVRALVDGHTETVDALFAGLSGGGAPAISGEVRAVLTRELPFVKSISNGSDALNGLYAGVGAGDGMVVIAGTGTSAFVRCGGVLTQVGGWGYLVDDAGSGYSIGRAVLNAAFRENTRCVFAETLTNPSLVVTDLEMFANAAHAHGVPCIVDNTFPTPINCRPFEFGVDIVTHSTTKYLDGHAVQLGGAIVDSGNFDWNNGKFPEFTEPDESYHGVIYTKQFGKKAYITKATSQLMRDLGSIPSPMNCFLLNLGLETLPLRVERHCSNAQKIAEYLNAHEKVSHVNYAGLPDDKYHALAQKYMKDGRTCGVISFELTGGRDAAVRFMDSLKLATIATHVAASITMVLHPASHTHRQMNDEQLVEAGVSPGMIRLSIGIENVDDIIKDLDQALKNA